MAEPEPLRGRSLPELREMLRRQERLLGDRKFISRLPDKGEKLSSFVEKLKIAITQEEALRRRTELLSTVRLEFQKRQYEPDSNKCGIPASKENPACEDLPRTPDAPASGAKKELGSTGPSQPSVWATKSRAKNKADPAEQALGGSDTFQGKDNVSEMLATSRLPLSDPHNAVGLTEDADGSTSRSSEALVEAFEGLSAGGREHERALGEEPTTERREKPFQGLPHSTPKMPHYMEVLEQRAQNPVGKRSTFKPNRIPAELSGSSHGSSEAPSPGSPIPSISTTERRRREKQHLEDITAARLPPLHHTPAQLLPAEESIALQVQQKAAYEEMQAKLAAQKLAQKLGIKMVAYEPEGEAAGSYREVEDEEAGSSTED